MIVDLMFANGPSRISQKTVVCSFITKIWITENESHFGENISSNVHILSLTSQLDQMKILFGYEICKSGTKVISM